MASLYKISGELLHIINQIEDQEGEVSPEQEIALAINKEQLSEKVVAFDYVIKMLNSEVDLAHDEIERIEKYIQRKKKAIENLQKFLLQSVLLFGHEQPNGVKKLECGNITLSTRKNPKSVDYDSQLDTKYYKYSVEVHGLTLEEYNELNRVVREHTSNMRNITFKHESKVSKTLIKEDLEKGEVPGAWFKEGDIKLVIK